MQGKFVRMECNDAMECRGWKGTTWWTYDKRLEWKGLEGIEIHCPNK
jgi:hypothetical protein